MNLIGQLVLIPSGPVGLLGMIVQRDINRSDKRFTAIKWYYYDSDTWLVNAEPQWYTDDYIDEAIENFNNKVF